jgi:hypothetical protein
MGLLTLLLSATCLYLDEYYFQIRFPPYAVTVGGV